MLCYIPFICINNCLSLSGLKVQTRSSYPHDLTSLFRMIAKTDILFFLPPNVDYYYFFRGGIPEYADALPMPAAGGGLEYDAAGPPVDEDTEENAGGSLPGEKPAKTRIRTEFPETWLWSDYVSE